MTETNIQQSLLQFFKDQFNVELPSASADLIEAGILDSLMLIELVVFIENEYSVATELDDLEMENFVTVDSMARFISARLPSTSQSEPTTVAGQGELAAGTEGGAT